jgi:hypothetical protein
MTRVDVTVIYQARKVRSTRSGGRHPGRSGRRHSRFEEDAKYQLRKVRPARCKRSGSRAGGGDDRKREEGAIHKLEERATQERKEQPRRRRGEREEDGKAGTTRVGRKQRLTYRRSG